VPLAATPLLFAVQQASEGALWLTLSDAPDAPDARLALALTVVFLMLAQMLWPVWSPLAAMLAEPRAARRRLMWPSLAAGIVVAAYFGLQILQRRHGAQLLDGHIVYGTGRRPSSMMGAGYLVATCAPLWLSSQRTVQLLGAIVLAGCAATFLAYWAAFVSVWCFFAAASGVIALHFERAGRGGRQAARRPEAAGSADFTPI
jgi:hypothetical protein